MRVFYDVTATTVEILAIVPKSEVDDWLTKAGKPEAIEGAKDEEGGTV